MNRYELYRLLAADQLGLLDAAGKRNLTEALADRPAVDRQAWATALREAVADPGSDAEFRQRIAAAGDFDPPVEQRSRRSGMRWRSPRVWRWVVAAAAAAAGIALVVRVFDPHSPRLPGSGVQVLALDADRSVAVRADLDADPAPALALEIEVPPGATRWEVRDGSLDLVASGEVAGSARAGGRLRAVVPKNRLRPANSYWLVVRGPSGDVLHQWKFDLD